MGILAVWADKRVKALRFTKETVGVDLVDDRP